LAGRAFFVFADPVRRHADYMRPHLAPLVFVSLALILGTAIRAEVAGYNPAKDTLVYVGTYTSGRSTSKGIHVLRLQTQNEDVAQNIQLVPLGLAAEAPDPAFLDLDLKRRRLFAAHEMNSFEGQRTGAISSYAIDPATGKLNLVNRKASMGTGPCHLVLDKEGRNVLVANYSGGTVVVLPVGEDGKLGDASAVIQHSGKSVNPQRQEAPHPHQVALDPANRFAYVPDLGIDKVMIYRFDAKAGSLAPAEKPFVAMKPGAGPRHMSFRPDGKFAYVLNELNSTVTALACDPATGALTEIETVSSLPPHFDGRNSGAEIAVLPNGRFLFVSNRGHNSLVLFAIDREKGTLTYVEEQGTGGKTPRHFGVQPNAKHLAIGNQDSNQVLICRIDPENGRLKPSGVFTDVPAPVCMVFLPPPSEVR
jgi:6-phosphogluconolactonase